MDVIIPLTESYEVQENDESLSIDTNMYLSLVFNSTFIGDTQFTVNQ
jgi:hypothetical protein